jgi:anti-sigma factor ChrR (cupin superfamily)
MNGHDFLDDDLRDQAAAYVLGSLAEDDARRYRVHLARCTACRAEVADVERVTSELAGLAPQTAPPPGMWDRVLDRVRKTSKPSRDENASDAQRASTSTHDDALGRQIWKAWAEEGARASPFTYVDVAGEFQPTAQAGISARKLFVDREHDRVTMLVRMDAGSAYPPHRHAGPEDCYVIAGDLADGERVLHAGDYVRAAPGSVHGVQSTEKGCLLLIVSSLGDELVA